MLDPATSPDGDVRRGSRGRVVSVHCRRVRGPYSLVPRSRVLRSQDGENTFSTGVRAVGTVVDTRDPKTRVIAAFTAIACGDVSVAAR
jgi:hypothetical protein